MVFRDFDVHLGYRYGTFQIPKSEDDAPTVFRDLSEAEIPKQEG